MCLTLKYADYVETRLYLFYKTKGGYSLMYFKGTFPAVFEQPCVAKVTELLCVLYSEQCCPTCNLHITDAKKKCRLQI